MLRKPQTRSGWVLLVLATLLIGVAAYNQVLEMERVATGVTDFGMFYDAAHAMSQGDSPYAATNGGYFYPPTFAFYFGALTQLPRTTASLVWFVLKSLFAIWTLRAVFQLLVPTDGWSLRRRRWFAVGVVVVALRFIMMDLQFGNTNTVILGLAVIAVLMDLRSRPALSGMALAMAISVKVVPGIFVLYFAARRRWRVLGWTLGVLIALNALPLVMNAVPVHNAWLEYVHTGVASKLGESLVQPDNQSIWGAIGRATGGSADRIRPIWAGLSMLLLVLGGGSASVSRRAPAPRQLAAAGMFFLIGLLVSPGSWVVHYCALLLPMATLLGHTLSARRTHVWVLLGAVFAATSLSGLFRFSVALSIEQSWFVVSAVLLLVLLVPVAIRPARAYH